MRIGTAVVFMVQQDALWEYQELALSDIQETTGPYKSLVMPTGSGKTRVALKYAEKKMKDWGSVAYIVKSDAHAEQVLREAKEIDVQAKFIPGSESDKATENRQYKLDEYDAGFHVGVFTYKGYFLGGGVERAKNLIVDDAHALKGQEISHSVIEIHKEKWKNEFEKILNFIKEENRELKPHIEALEKPVHRGGGTVFVPPPEDPETGEKLRKRINALTEGTGWEKYFLGERLDASKHFPYWPCVVTLNSIRWRPFILPFESYGNNPREPIKEDEILALTSTKDSEQLLQLRLGLPSSINQVQPEDVPEMGRRLVIPYPKYGSDVPPSDSHINSITTWANEFGSVLVSVSSDDTHTALEKELDNNISVHRYRSDELLDDYRDLSEPKVLVLVNRPSGIDLHSSICKVGIHLDLPYSASGHETVAGDVEESGSVADASLAVRLSQLLGRLNRKENHRSVHLILGGDLPLQRDSVFVKSLDPTVLLDLLIGKFGLHREYDLPTDEELLQTATSFINGEDKAREKHQSKAESVRKRYLAEDDTEFSIDNSELVEANLYAARGNFSTASKKYAMFAQDADVEEHLSRASFYELQALCYCSGVQKSVDEVLNRQRGAIIEEALDRNPGSGTIVSALHEMQSEDGSGEEELELNRLDLKREAIYEYQRWIDTNEEQIPDPSDRDDQDKWTSYWEEQLAEPDHEELLDIYCDIFQLLGSNTPEKGIHDNDAKVVWDHREESNYKIALEVKGWEIEARDSPPEVKVDNVTQARENASDIEADSVLLATSRRGRQRRVASKAKELRVHIIRHHTSRVLATKLAEQCVALHKYSKGIIGREKIPYVASDIEEFLDGSEGGTIAAEDLKEKL